MGVASIYAKLNVAIRQVHLEKPLKSTYSGLLAKIHVGHKRYTHRNVRPVEDFTAPLINYAFTVSYHAHLFWSLVIDVYQERTLLGPLHLGRGEMRLCRLEGLPTPYVTWLELREGRGSLSPSLTHIGLKELEKTIGQIQVEFSYVPVPEKPLPALPPAEDSPPALSVEETSASIITDGELLEASLQIVPNGEASPALSLSVLSVGSTLSNESTASSATHSDITTEPEELTGILSRLASLVLNERDQEALKAVQIILTVFNQNVIHISNMTLTIGYIQLQRYYNHQPIIMTKNFIIDYDSMLLPRALYRYTQATTGWIGLNYSGKRKSAFLDFFRSRADYQAVMDYMGLEPGDILIFSLGNDEALRPNFFVAHDKKLGAIVLAIRGTMSFRDVLTDLVCEYVPWKNGYVHAGILSAARWFMSNVIPQLRMFAQELQATAIYITGHSLGGAVASMTTILFLDELHEPGAEWPTSTLDDQPLRIHCYSFGPPPILSYNLHGLYRTNIDCFVNGDDIVPRLCYGTAADLQLLIQCVAGKATAGSLFKDNPASLEAIRTCRQALRSLKINPKLYLVGNVHHMVNVYVHGAEEKEMVKHTLVESVTAEYFDEMVVCKKMFMHHMPDSYDRGVENALLTFEAARLGDTSGNEQNSIRELAARICMKPPKWSKGRTIEISETPIKNPEDLV